MKKLAPGFLVAMPQLGDLNFHRSVILMVEHGEGGSMGLVVNRTAPLTLKDLAKGQDLQIAKARENDAVFVGGPVEPQRGFVLHDRAELSERQEVLRGLYLSVTVEALGPLLRNESAQLRFVLGCSGWGPKQLEQEMALGAWLFTEASAAAILKGDPAQMWDATIRSMGVDPAMLLPAKGVH